MKKILSILSVMCLSLSVFAADPQPDAFAYEGDVVSSEFKQLEKIEKYVEKNNTSLEELKNQNADLVKNLDLSTDSAAAFLTEELPLGIPAFWWGCVLGIIGVVVVYVITDKDKDQTKKALLGCLVAPGIIVLIWVVLLITGGSFLFL